MAEWIQITADEARLSKISDQIVRYANADFSKTLEISPEKDAIDSITVGLNLLGEELKAYIDDLADRERQLERAVARLREAQHIAHVGSWEWDIINNSVEWSDELYDIFKASKDKLTPTYQGYLEFVHPEDRTKVDKLIKKAYEDHKPFTFYHRSVREDKTIRVILSRGEVHVNEIGLAVKMTGTAQDVTEIKETEDENLRLSAIVESSSDAIISKTTDGIILSWNAQAEKLFGYKREEVIGRHISLLFPPERLHEETEIINTILKGGSLVNFETVRRKKDGSNIDLSLTLSPIYDAGKTIVGISKIARDITEKKKAEKQLEKYTRDLEYRNSENRQFTYIASHDLQEPLRTITNYIHLFASDYKGRLEGNADIYINFISKAASRMQRLIQDLLEYNKVEDAQKVEVIDLNVLVKEILESMAASINNSGAQIIVEELPTINGYDYRIHSLFANLISNALKYRRQDVIPEIRISYSENENNWLFKFTDNGIGIEKIYADRIFKLFQRLHTREEYEGTGIGLALCKKIVELRGGKIWVESEPGKGSTFFVLLPKKFDG